MLQKPNTRALSLAATLGFSLLLASCGTTTIAETTGMVPGSLPQTVSTTFSKAFYVDQMRGNDNNDGLTPTTAWRSLSKANAASLQPGEALLFKRGTSYNGTLRAKWVGTSSNPIIIGAYGEGENPWIRGSTTAVNISGQHQIVEHLQVTTSNTPGPNLGAVNCKTTPMGWHVGFVLETGATRNTIRQSFATGLTAGIHFVEGATYNKALNNRLVGNTVMSRNDADNGDNDSGAWGILINGDHNEIAHNYFEGNTACSEDYGVEGASLEVYKGSHNHFHRNTSINDTTFTELGGTSSKWATNNRYEFNLYAPLNTNGHGEALVIRGLGSKWGANPGTVFNNNTVFNTNLGVYCGEVCSTDILTLRDNIIVTRAGATKDTVWTDGPINQSGNVFWQLDGQYKVTINQVKDSTKLGTSLWADPRLADPLKRNFTLRAAAPLPTAGAFPR